MTKKHNFFHQILPYWRLVFRYPLYFLNAAIAALFTNMLLTLQPGLLKVFINEAKRGVSEQQLLTIVFFMLSALFLAFLFETIQVSTAHYFKLSIENYLRQIHYKYSKNRDIKEIGFPIQKGIYGLTQFSLLTSLELIIALINLSIVVIFIYFSNAFISLVITLLLFLAAIISIKPIFKIGKISKQKENDKKDCIPIFNSNSTNRYLIQLTKIQSQDGKLFLLETSLVFISFTLFKVLPTLILIYFLKNDPGNIGEMASYFLYFTLLRNPYNKLILIIKQSTQFFSQAELFKDDIEHALRMDNALSGISHGIICHAVEDDNTSGVKSRDQGDKNVEENNQLLLFSSTERDKIKKSHLVIDENYKLIPTPVYLWNLQNE